MQQLTKYTCEYEIRAYNCNALEELTLKNLAHFFQDVADRQSALYNYGYDYLISLDIAWILVNYNIVINKMPRWGDTIKISSWVSTLKKISSRREFSVECNGEVIVTASTQWVALNKTTKKITNIFDFMGDFIPLEEYATQTTFPKIRKPENMLEQKAFVARFDDLDPNKHVNNANYFAWAYEAFGNDWINEHYLQEIEINFKNETLYNEKLTYNVIIEDDLATQFATKEDGTDAIAVRTRWLKKQ